MNFSNITFSNVRVESGTPDMLTVKVDADLTASTPQATLDILFKGNKIGEFVLREAVQGQFGQTRTFDWKIPFNGRQSAMDIFKSYYTTQRKEEITFRLSASSVYTTPKLSFGTSYLQGEKHNMVSKVRVYVPNVISGIFFAMFSSNNTRSVSVDLDFVNPFGCACELTDMVIEVKKGNMVVATANYNGPMSFKRGNDPQPSSKKAITGELKASILELMGVIGTLSPAVDVYVKSATIKLDEYVMRQMSMEFFKVELDIIVFG